MDVEKVLPAAVEAIAALPSLGALFLFYDVRNNNFKSGANTMKANVAQQQLAGSGKNFSFTDQFAPLLPINWFVSDSTGKRTGIAGLTWPDFLGKVIVNFNSGPLPAGRYTLNMIQSFPSVPLPLPPIVKTISFNV